MADMMNPQTPPRKLFKPSSKTKTPTPAKKQTPTTPTPSKTQFNDTFSPIDVASKAAEAPRSLSRSTSGATKATNNGSREGGDTPKKSSNIFKTLARKPREALDSSTDDLPGSSNPTDALNSPTDIAKYFADQGNTEMSHFISALAGTASQGPASTAGDGADSTDAPGDDPTTGTPESIKELPRDDALVSSPNERTKEILSEAGRNVSQGKSQKLEDEFNGAGAEGSKTSDSVTPEPADISKEAEGSTNAAQEQDGDAKPVNITGEPDTANISKDAQVDVSHGKEKMNGFARVASDGTGLKANKVDSNKPSDNTQVADNMGKPAHIERRIEIPLPRPEKVVSSPPEPNKPDTDNITNGLRSTDDLPGTEDLPSINGLPGLPDDPPEEILDPSVHSPSSNISPIPKIPKVAPIGIAPPPDLLDLAHGLGGNTVDDVGNIVDASGEVLGHATGDLPAMVGRQVADNGEIHGEDGEIVGYVSENFTDPPPADIPENVLGGLKIDHQGNILDASGNIIGRFNEKAGENGALAPFLNRRKSSNPRTESKPQDEKPPKVNAQTGGSPSDLFLDVKSTADGIQLIIRIPTMFGKQPQD